MWIDLLMGTAAIVLGAALAAYSRPLADHLQDGDDRYRERFPWVQAFEPQAGRLATAAGRWVLLRGAVLAAALAYAGVGIALASRVVLG